MFKILLQIRSVIYNCQAINIIYLHSGTTAILISKYTFGSITKNFVSLQIKTPVSDICHIIT